MYDPDHKPKPKTQVGGTTFEPPITSRVVPSEGIQSAETSLKHYLTHSKTVWEAHGLKRENGKLVVGDLEKIKSFDERTKEILRQVLKGI